MSDTEAVKAAKRIVRAIDEVFRIDDDDVELVARAYLLADAHIQASHEKIYEISQLADEIVNQKLNDLPFEGID